MIGIGSDHAGYELKEKIKKYLNELDLEIKDDDKKEYKPVVRKDEVKKFECKDLFRNVKSMRDTYIEVPKIIE